MEENITDIVADTVTELLDMLGHGEAGFDAHNFGHNLYGASPVFPSMAGIHAKSQVIGEPGTHLFGRYLFPK